MQGMKIMGLPTTLYSGICTHSHIVCLFLRYPLEKSHFYGSSNSVAGQTTGITVPVDRHFSRTTSRSAIRSYLIDKFLSAKFLSASCHYTSRSSIFYCSTTVLSLINKDRNHQYLHPPLSTFHIMPHSSRGCDPSSQDRKKMAYVKYRRRGEARHHHYPLPTKHHDDVEVVSAKNTERRGNRPKSKHNSTEKHGASGSKTNHRQILTQQVEEERDDICSLRDSVPRNGIRRDENINRPYQPTDDLYNCDGSWRGVTSAPLPPASRYYGINSANAVGDGAGSTAKCGSRHSSAHALCM
ncbi:hypothetical protein N7G274_000197 [Stereocaulon virgatum]|uniref:Uncharacterized protein n=1 Tax=Stereocaulon virgatum TaxID=373712 RepID=A0ABR4AU67_9LECA